MNRSPRLQSTLRCCGRYWRLQIILLVLAGCSKPPEQNATLPTKSPDESRASGVANEQSWIVQSITEEITRVAAFAAKLEPDAPAARIVTEVSEHRNPQGYDYTCATHLPGQDAFRAPVDISGAIWNPDAYVPFAHEVLQRLRLEGEKGPGSIGGKPLVLLTNPRIEVIQRENERISQWLTAHPLDALAHEQAALLVGSLALRENSGSFWDTRGFCNRAVVHLAFAKALRGEAAASDCGSVAELLVGLLMDTKADCERRIDALAVRAADVHELKPWVTAARLRNRRDYRILPSLTDATLLEKIELFRATGEAAGSTAACNALAEAIKEPLADWTRILLQFDFKVGEGHQFTRAALPFELAEASKIFPALADPKLTPEGLAKHLNQAPGHLVNRSVGGSAAVDVIDRGTWAMFFQRHLCHAFSRIYYFLAYSWGVPEEAANFRRLVDTRFKSMTLAPLVTVESGDPSWVRSDSPAIIALLSAHPEWVTDTIWARLIPKLPIQKLPAAKGAGLPLMQDWFSPSVPTGTAYCFWSRAAYLPQMQHLTEVEARRFYEIAPWSFGVAQKLLTTRFGPKPDASQCKEVIGRYLEYYQAAMQWHARAVKADPAEYRLVMQRLAEQDPMYYLTLGQYLADRRMDAAAVEAFESAMERKADPIAISNSCEWLVNYYVDHGRTERAIEIAKFAADVYSSRGLDTMGKLMERLDRLSEAEDHYKKLQERYEDGSSLAAFYQRQLLKDPGSVFAARFREIQKGLFPKGVHETALSDFKGPPSAGVLIRQENDLLRRSGLKAMDVIVAIDGKRVETLEQYAFIRGLTASDEMDLIVYSAGKYAQVHAKAPGRRFQLDFVTYRP
jgi:tetratricopeptide (TPR) repeat protein